MEQHKIFLDSDLIRQKGQNGHKYHVLDKIDQRQALCGE